jgi:hypothetical protein
MWVRYKEDGAIPDGIPKAYGGVECRFCQFASKCVKMEGSKHPIFGQIEVLEIKKNKHKDKKLPKKQQSTLDKLLKIVVISKGEIV